MDCTAIDTCLEKKLDICLIFDEFGGPKTRIYYAIQEALIGTGCNVDVKVHHCNQDIFSRLLRTFLDKYTHFVIVPYFTEGPTLQTIRLINQIPERKLIFLDEDFKLISHNHYGAIIQDYEEDLFQALNHSIEKIRKYDRFVLVCPKVQYPYLSSIIDGFEKFCSLNLLDFMVTEGVVGSRTAEGDLFLVIDDADLVDLIKSCRQRSWQVGKQLGVISYNQSPLKEILENGISVVSGDFDQMAKRTVEMLLTGDLKIEKNPFSFIDNCSF